MAEQLVDQVMTATGLWSKEEKQSTEGPVWYLGQKPVEVESPSHIQLPPSPTPSSYSFDNENVVAVNVEELYPMKDEKGPDSAETPFEDTDDLSPVSDQSMHDAVERAPDHVDADQFLGWTEKNERTITRPFEYLMAKPGKSFRRQLLTALNAWTEVDEMSFGIINRVVEMLHNASLLYLTEYDSKLRRGSPAAHLVFGTAQTINAANYVYFLSLRELAGLQDAAAAMQIFNEELLNLHRGQGLDLFWRETLTVPTEGEYLQMISLKTGGLFRVAARLLQSASSKQFDLVPLMEVASLIFQIRDDYQNLCSESMMSAKGYCDDLTEGKFSFPVIHSIRNSADGNSELVNILKQHTEDIRLKAQAVWYMQSETDSFEYTKQKLKSLHAEARTTLSRTGPYNEAFEQVMTKLTARLDDLCVRFIINLPKEELKSVERICFQVEEAQWYYEDFIRPLDPELPSLNLRNFCLRIFQHCPLLSEYSPHNHAAAFEQFLAYKTRVPVRGAILLNEEMDEVILVKGWKKGSNWSFPRGKINQDETDLDCAVREVYEETGYHVAAAGLVEDADKMKHFDIAIQHQHLRLYVFRGVPMDTPFEARTRKEISRIDWWKLSDLPTLKKRKQQQEGHGEDLATTANKFYMVAPFLVPLKKWISQQKKRGKSDGTDDMLQPTDNEVEHSTAGNIHLNGTRVIPVSEDIMTRLQPPAQIPSADEASLKLKSLLRVLPIEPSSGFPADRSDGKATQDGLGAVETRYVEENKAATLLALLKGAPSKHKPALPQTPLDQVIETPPMPEPLRPHPTARLLFSSPNEAHQLTPSIYTAIPNQPGNIAQSIAHPDMSRVTNPHKNSIAAWNNYGETVEETEAARNRQAATRRAEEQKMGSQHQPQLPAMRETWKQVKISDGGDMRQADQRRLVQVLKRPVGASRQSVQDQSEPPIQPKAAIHGTSRSMPAPYQATSHMQTGTTPQYPEIYRPTIPAANKLPMPKLTAHSSTLLNLFKDGPSGKPAVASEKQTRLHEAAESVQAPTPSVTSNSNKQNVSLNISRPPKPTDGPPTTALPTLQKTVDPNPPHSAHQANLLSLFRKPSVPTIESPSTSKTTNLDVPTDVVELSATPKSPGHSTKPDAKAPARTSISPSMKSRSIKKRLRADSKQGSMPVSATVNGPLNVPNFDIVARQARETAQKPIIEAEGKKSPMTILARSEKTALTPNPSDVSNLDGQRNGPAIPSTAGLNGESSQTSTSKTFQPQILRRPPPPAPAITKAPVQRVSPIRSPAPAHVQPPVKQPPPTRKPEAILQHHSSIPSPTGQRQQATPPVSAATDRRPSTKPEHKATLLSLFTKVPSPSVAPSPGAGPDLSAFVSPVAMQPAMSFPRAPVAMATESGDARSRTGSAAAGAEEKEKPRKATSEIDRNFLLGYLDGVARKEGR
ncbi:MAG: hypothetical protein Q9202_004592 [Teloschistes flavicans]